MPRPPWSQPSGVESVVDGWLAAGSVRRCLAAERLLEPRAARYAPIPEGVNAALRRVLEQRGITRLYAHQARAVTAALAGRHVVISTPTASGKSLCFHLPVVQAMADDPASSALFVYPTKALSRDQEHSLRRLIGEAELPLAAAVFDGDTPGDARRSIRERSRIVLTNPDMLHSGVLPNHTRWLRLFRGLRYVVLDELHTYRGVFGSHMAHVLGRLKRLARFHGADPCFIAATATIGNPLTHAARLFGVDESAVELVDESGAPEASRRFFVYNPPVVNAELGVRASTLKESVKLTTDLVRAKVPTIVFGQSRNSVEVMLKYLRAEAGNLAAKDAIMAYRGGYLPEERRRIEQGLREGTVRCVVATNALELGIDIGDLDAVVCAGYPGSIAGLWQRFGRAGRRGSTSIALLVCSSASLDQFLAREPQYLLRSGAEEARIDPKNVEIVIQHLKCAAFEAPFALEAPRGAALGDAESPFVGLDAQGLGDALGYLAEHGLVHAAEGRYFWSGDAFPASNVSLRNVGWDNFVIVDVESENSIAELDWRAAHTMLHEQAIYQHDAEQYQVERLDFENHKAFVRRVAPDYFTTALTYRSVVVLDVRRTAALHAGDPVRGFSPHEGPASHAQPEIGFGDVKVLEKVTGYKKVKFFTHENAGYGDVHLPEMEMQTTSFWLTLPDELIERFMAGMPSPDRAAALDAIRAIGAALETVSTLALMCDPRDINRTLGDGSRDGSGDGSRDGSGDGSRDASGGDSRDGSRDGEERAPGRVPRALSTDGIGRTGSFHPTLFLFDALPGGVGLAERLYERAPELLRAAHALIASCGCDAGCPGCIGPGFESQAAVEPGSESRKALALGLLELFGVVPSLAA